MTINLMTARKCLAGLWLTWGIGLAVFLVLVTNSEKVNPDLGEPKALWSWFVSILLPIEGLIVGILASGATIKLKESARVATFFLAITFFLSIAFLSVLTITAIDALTASSLTATLESSELYLQLFQPLLITCLTVFFVKKD